jgi:hypothetical protein
MTGIELVSRTRRSSSIPSIWGILMSKTPRSGVDAGQETLGLERDRHRGQDVAIVIDERDHMAHASSYWPGAER